MTTASARGIHRRLTINATPEFVDRILRRATPRPNGCLEWTVRLATKGTAGFIGRAGSIRRTV